MTSQVTASRYGYMFAHACGMAWCYAIDTGPIWWIFVSNLIKKKQTGQICVWYLLSIISVKFTCRYTFVDATLVRFCPRHFATYGHGFATKAQETSSTWMICLLLFFLLVKWTRWNHLYHDCRKSSPILFKIVFWILSKNLFLVWRRFDDAELTTSHIWNTKTKTGLFN